MLDVPDFNTTGEEPPRAPTNVGFGRFVVVMVLAAAAVFGISRYTGRAARVAAADRAAGIKPVLLMFTADWCGPCQAFKGNVLADDRVFDRLHQQCRFEKVDLTKWQGKPADVATSFGVSSIPTLILVNSQGQEIDRYDGPHDPAHFASWLDQYTL
jgi:thiol:disulfide interchange protein